jgi:3-oxoacid CoA-transferase subunit A
MQSKIFENCKEALHDLLFDGMTIMAGGFGLCGIPENLIEQIKISNVKNLTIISNNCGVDDFGLGILLANGQIKKMISSYVGENKIFEKMLLENKLELELLPQGTLAEKIRAAGAGIPAFYTKTGFGTVVQNGKEVKNFNGNSYLMEEALHVDLAIIKGYKADLSGNIIYRKTARNFNQVMATAAKTCVCEVEEIAGYLDPDAIHTPNIFIQRLVKGAIYEKRIEKKTINK